MSNKERAFLCLPEVKAVLLSTMWAPDSLYEPSRNLASLPAPVSTLTLNPFLTRVAVTWGVIATL